MKREAVLNILSKLGLEDDVLKTALESIMKEHGVSVTTLKTDKEALNEKYNTLLTEKNTFETKYNATLTEEQRVKAEYEKMQSEVETYKRNASLAKHTQTYLELGYDKELANSTASALLDNNFEIVAKNQSTFIENLKKQTAKTTLEKTPGIEGGKPQTSGFKTLKEVTEKLNPTQLGDYIKDNPQEYQTLVSNARNTAI